MHPRRKRYLPQECDQDGISIQPAFQRAVVILDEGGGNDELDIRCVWSGGAVLDVIIVFRRREQLLIVRSEEGDRFSKLRRVSKLVKACREEGPTLVERGPVPKIWYRTTAFNNLKVLDKSYGFV